MSRRGNCYDNAMAENFFSILKTECIYRHKPKTLQEAKNLIDSYIHFYNHYRIQLIITTGPNKSIIIPPPHPTKSCWDVTRKDALLFITIG
jgi:transposase InsO family protein